MESRRDLLKFAPVAAAAAAAAIGRPAVASLERPPAPEVVFNVRNYGATGDGRTVDTPAINRAIDVLAAAGGGTLLFPSGTYLCFTIRLRSHMQLYLSPGCIILAADSPHPGETTGYGGGTYDAAGPPQPWEAFQDYGHNHWPNSLFYGEGLSDISITGPGLIHGRGLSCGNGVRPAPDPLRGAGVQFRAEQAGVGNKAIALKNCHNITLRDFAILKGGHFALLATGVDNLTLDNLLVDTDRDGFDIDCCRNVRITNCTVNSPWDDAICPKSSYALGYARSTDNVTISDCFVTGTYELGSVLNGTWKKFPPEVHVSRQGRIKCGTESNGGIRNITISNCVCEGSKGISLETSDGASLEDIAISNITMRDTVDAPLFLRLNRRNRGPAETMRPGTLRRIVISNVVSHDSAASTASLFSGIPGNFIEDVKLANCYFGHLSCSGPRHATLSSCATSGISKCRTLKSLQRTLTHAPRSGLKTSCVPTSSPSRHRYSQTSLSEMSPTCALPGHAPRRTCRSRRQPARLYETASPAANHEEENANSRDRTQKTLRSQTGTAE